MVGLALAGQCLYAGAQPPGPGAQAQPQPGSTGTVTGTVLAQDTQRPVRLAQVSLQSVAAAQPDGQPAGDGPQAGGRVGSGNGFGGGFGGSQGRTEADGSFTLENVAPGDYYVTAGAPGFIPLRSQLLAQVAAGADPAALLAAVPVVHVAAGSTSSVTVTLERGASVTGRLQWEDGSPASGIYVSVLPSSGSGSSVATQSLPAQLQFLRSPGGANQAQTDDRGVFRLSGLATGDYVVEATIQTFSQFGGQFGGRGQQVFSPVRVYAPGVFRRSAAKPVSLRAGEERGDVRIVLDLRGLKTVAGHAGSTDPGSSVASGRVSLVDTGDATLQMQGSIDAHGDFTVRYVPPGNYTLTVSGASSQASGFRGRGGESASSTPAVRFQSFSETVVVTDTDLTGLPVMLTPVATKP